jgi:hypothetical protein
VPHFEVFRKLLILPRLVNLQRKRNITRGQQKQFGNLLNLQHIYTR